MNELEVMEYKNIRVLTTQQLAESYETDTKVISNNFNRNKDRYVEGKHYICLEGNALKDFKTNHQFEESSKVNKFYLWTEKGAFLHAKSLNTDRAWEVYDHLVDSYFKGREEPLTQLEIMQKSIQILNEHDGKIKNIDVRMDKLEFEIPLYGSEADELSNHVKRKGVAVMGGKKTEAYKDTNIRSKVYRDIYDQLKREFGLYSEDGRPTSYKALKRKCIYEAHEFVDCYQTSTYLQELIDSANAQLSLEIAG